MFLFVKISCFAVLAVMAAVGGGLYAADPAAPAYLIQSIRQVAEEGKFDHALRAVDMRLAAYPDDPTLSELRASLVEARKRSIGNQTTSSAATVALPVITFRRAESGRDFTTETADIPMIWIKPGTFRMSQIQGSDDDTQVTLTRGYWLGRTEVTQEQWQVVMEDVFVPNYFKGSDRPVERVSWVFAMEFARRLTERERAAGRMPHDYDYTLPTEAQWEYACRAGTTGPHAGELSAMAWYELNSDRQTHPVAQKQPNAWGLYDMHGNVWEWCADASGGYPGGQANDPMTVSSGSTSGSARIMRGGGWNSGAGECRSAFRFWQSLNHSGLGFRLALAPRTPLSPRHANSP